MKPYVKITEQPTDKALRFRYKCESRSAGTIPGVNSTPEKKTYPTIEIVGYKGRAVVVVSCVTKDEPHRPHPHNLVGKEGCKKGVCTLKINNEKMRSVVFSNLGIQCVKKKDIDAALKTREDMRVDPFKTGFSHRFQPSSIDLNSVRLCFQVFTESEQKGRFTQPLPPVVSEPIFSKKGISDLVICRLCRCSASVLGNTQIILLCEKVAKEDIAVRFFEEKNGKNWEAFGEFQHNDVHNQTTITFKTPRYHTIDITEPAKVFIQLQRPSDGVTSEPLPFEYVPLGSDMPLRNLKRKPDLDIFQRILAVDGGENDRAHLTCKRRKTGGDAMHLLLQQQHKQQQNERQQQQQQQQLQLQEQQDGQPINMPCWNPPNIPAIKTEPRDSPPQQYLHYRPSPDLTPSPQPLSPTNNYMHKNSPSPYGMTAGGPSNGPMLSPNQQYNGSGGDASPMSLQDYNVFVQQQQHQQQQHQQQHQQQQQQHFQANIFGTAAATHWDGKYSAVALNANNSNNNNNINNNNNSMTNLSNANQFNMQNLLSSTPHAAAGGVGGVGAGHAHWNLAPNLMQQHHMQQPQEQQQYQQQMPNDAATINASSNQTNNNNNNSEHGPTLSNLLNFDSEQLVRINSEDQQMLRLNSEDLQLSNLSIST